MSKSKRTPHKKGGRKEATVEVVGKVSMSREGYAFIKIEGEDEEIFVDSKKLKGALHGDTVKVVLSKKRGERREGQVMVIVERSKIPFVGTLHLSGEQAWVIMESKNMPYDISIPYHPSLEKSNGLKAAVVIEGWPPKSHEPIGRIVDILGKSGENETEMHAILTQFGLPYRFDQKVVEAANKIPEEIGEEEIAKRRDLRQLPTFTIDPKEAKDFDDALSIVELKEGVWQIGIHIADVTHFVAPGSIIDKEAYKRGTSVYLPDRTVPMLPERLSNSLCSLNPNEDKLCFSALFEMNKKGKVTGRWFGKTVINSKHRFNYTQVEEILEEREGPFSRELLALNHLALLLREERFKAGALNFEKSEIKIIVDSSGKPIDIVSYLPTQANWLIEEFMLLANREVAYKIGVRGQGDKRAIPPFIYRVHDEPNLEKVAIFRTFLKHLGYKIKATKNGKELSGEINRLFEQIKGKPEMGAVEIMALRSMARAHYSTDNVGHYGLAFDHYTHFTSPIRRYPDMVVHRLLQSFLENKKGVGKATLERDCKHSSEREQLAADAERAGIKYKMVEFMQDKVGKEYSGVVSGITEWGMFVELDSPKAEGMIPLREIKEDYLIYHEESLSLRGKVSGKKFIFGTPVKIKVVRANLEQKQLDFALIWEEEQKK
ncbi:MAG: ribonuclease R, partial [Bacteroidales bacterium]